MGNNHSDEYDSIDIYDYESPSAPSNISVSQEYIFSKDLDFKYVSVKEYSHMNTSSSSHPYPLCSIVCNTPTWDEDIPCSSSYSSDEFTFWIDTS